MAAGPVGGVWASGSWSDTCWEEDTWADEAQISGLAGFHYGFRNGLLAVLAACAPWWMRLTSEAG